MSAERFVLEKFLKVVWHANKVEFDFALVEVNSGWMDISKDES